MPVMAFVIAYHLGIAWVELLCYQTVQGLSCETRKWRSAEDEVAEQNERRPGWTERAVLYMQMLTIFAFDWKLPLTLGGLCFDTCLIFTLTLKYYILTLTLKI